MSQFKKYLEIIQETKLYTSEMKEQKPTWYFKFIPELKIGDDISKKIEELEENNKRAFFKMEYSKESNRSKRFGDLIINININNINIKDMKSELISQYMKYFDKKYWNHFFKPPIKISSIKKSQSFKGYGEITDFEIKEPITIEQGNSALKVGKIIKGTVLFHHTGVN